MHRTVLIAVLIVTLLTNLGHAQSLYNDSLRPGAYGTIRSNDRGMTFRGGTSFWPYGGPDRDRTLFRGGAEVGGVCGGFDSLLTFTEQFAELPGLLVQLAGPLAAGFVFQIMCETAPSYCQIIQQIYQSANVLIQANGASCERLFMTGRSLASSTQREALKKCIEDKQAAGTSRNAALRDCPGEINHVQGINGLSEPEFGVIEALIRSSTGLPDEDIALYTDLVGDIRLHADGSVFSQSGQKRSDSVMPKYQEIVEEKIEAVGEAVGALSAGTLPSSAVLGQLGGPGYAASADALLEISQTADTELRQFEIVRYATNLAYQKMVSDIHEMAGKLSDASSASAMTPEIRAAVEQKRKYLERQVTRLREIREAAKPMEQQTLALLERRARRFAEAAAIAESAVSRNQGSRYPGGQRGMGYRR